MTTAEGKVGGEGGEAVGCEDEPCDRTGERGGLQSTLQEVLLEAEHGEGGEVRDDRGDGGEFIGEEEEDAQ